MLDQQGQPSGMVDVRMCDQCIVDRAWRKGQGTVVFVSCALLQAAVNQDALVTNFQAMALPVTVLSAPKKESFIGSLL